MQRSGSRAHREALRMGAPSTGGGGGHPTMSEPKTVATSMREIVPGLFHYSILDERVRSQSDAYAVVAVGRAVLIDPLPIEAPLLERLGAIEAIVLGAPSH